MTSRKPVGWRFEPGRHSLASRGIKTGTKNRRQMAPAYRSPAEQLAKPPKETPAERMKRETLALAAQPTITEREIKLLHLRINTGKVTFEEVNAILEQNQPVVSDPSQVAKGRQWLLKWSRKQKRGEFEPWMTQEVEQMREFRLAAYRPYKIFARGFAGSGSSFPLTVYAVIGKDGSESFSYTVAGGEFREA